MKAPTSPDHPDPREPLAPDRDADGDADRDADADIDTPEGRPAASAAQPGTATRGRRRRPPRRRWLVTACVAWLTLLVLAAIFADLLPLASYDAPIGAPSQPPGLRWELLGTDSLGRSALSRVIYGARISLTVAVGSVGLGLLAGSLIGMVAGYFRGWVDEVVGVVIDSMLAFPSLVLLLAITAVLTPSLGTLTVALSILTVPSFARLARGSTLAVASRDFVTASRALGNGHGRVLLRDVAPNIALPVASYAFLIVAVVMVAEGSLSFLGMGVPPPRPSWGGMINLGRPRLMTDAHLVFTPAAFLMVTVFALNIVGDHARSRLERPGSANA